MAHVLVIVHESAAPFFKSSIASRQKVTMLSSQTYVFVNVCNKQFAQARSHFQTENQLNADGEYDGIK